MAYSGRQFINAIVKRLEDKKIPPHDSAILWILRGLDGYELEQLINFGDIDEWIRDRNKKGENNE